MPRFTYSYTLLYHVFLQYIFSSLSEKQISQGKYLRSMDFPQQLKRNKKSGLTLKPDMFGG